MNPNSPLGLALRRFRRHRLAMFSLGVLTLLLVLVMSAGLIEQLLGVEANGVNLMNRMAPPDEVH